MGLLSNFEMALYPPPSSLMVQLRASNYIYIAIIMRPTTEMEPRHTSALETHYELHILTIIDWKGVFKNMPSHRVLQKFDSIVMRTLLSPWWMGRHHAT